ncbi:MAG TPA: alpha/beta hydrolase [Aestuariivirgaceae bacterium]
MIKALVILGVAYTLVIIAIALAQTRLLFPAGMAATSQVQLPETAHRLILTTKDGAHLHGVHIPPTSVRLPGAALLLGFGGNAWNAETLAAYLSAHVPNRDVVVFHYRGYGPSEGSPSAAALLEDALAIHDHVAATIGPDRIVTIGLSIGAGPAAYVARHRNLAGVILVTPFDSLKALAKDHYWWAPVGLLLRHHMEIAALVKEIEAPVAIIAAERDRIVPPPRTQSLRASLRRVALDRTIGGVGHNDIYDHPEFAAALHEALDAMDRRILSHGNH